MKYIGWIILIALIIWGVIALFGGDANDAEAGPIRVGVVVPLTGDAAALGEPGLNAVTLAVEELNASGGVNGRQIELLVEDGKCDGGEAATVTQKLVNIDDVKYIIGGFCSNESQSMIPIAEKAEVVMLSPSSSAPSLTGISPFFARTFPSDAAPGIILADEAFSRGWRKAAILQEQSDYALGLESAFRARFEELGGAVVTEVFLATETDFRTSLVKLKDVKPDALFVNPQTPANGERILTQLKSMGWDLPLMTNDIGSDSGFLANHTERLEGTLMAIFGENSSDPRYQELLNNYKDRFGKDLAFPNYGQAEYDAVYLLADAIRARGDDPVKVADWLHDVSGWRGASGKINIGANGDRIGGHSLMVIKDGKVVKAE